jgi:hypothetical protein
MPRCMFGPTFVKLLWRRGLAKPVAWRTEDNVRFANRATRLPRGSEMTRWATGGHSLQVGF